MSLDSASVNSATANRTSVNSKQVTLRLNGSLESGFQAILEVRQGLDRILTESSGTLPACSALIPEIYNWQKSYWACLKQGRISGFQVEVLPGRAEQIKQCDRQGYSLSQQFCDWLNAPGLQALGFRLREVINPNDEVQFLLRSTDIRLHRLPWHHWPLLESYPRLEVAFGNPPQWIERPASPSQQVRILAILGDRTNIDVDVDRDLLSKLPQAEVKFLVEPSRAELTELLWQQSWDILFFAGHSHSVGQQGQISINATESLSIEQLSNGLQQAIRNGLQLAIFNSCDGLGIAYELEALHLPQLIVMREPVPDNIAQRFLKAFLAKFSTGSSLAEALRQAREQLQGLESEHPAATWLPVLFQNSAMLTPTWQSLQKHPEPPRPLWQRLVPPLGIGTAAAGIAIATRLLGLLQPAELALFDHFTRSRPTELPDNRILIVKITQDDKDQEAAAGLSQQGFSISDQRLNQVVDQLAIHNPRLIGLDLYRETREFKIQDEALNRQLATRDNLLAVCFASADPAQSGDNPKPEAVPSDRITFSNVVTDANRMVRIQLLAGGAEVDPNCPADYSLSALLATKYLAAEDVDLKFIQNNKVWQWGNAQIAPIGATSNFNPAAASAAYGPYANLDAAGSQILLNYRASQLPGQEHKSPLTAFPSVTIAEVLSGQVNKEQIEDKLILIGVDPEGFVTPTAQIDYGLDYRPTPYRDRQGDPILIPGVYLQAQMASQIISASLDQRKLLRALPWFVDALLVWAISVLLLGLAQGHRPKWIGAGLLGAWVAAYGSALGAFILLGLYLPLLPLALALLLGGGGIRAWRSLTILPTSYQFALREQSQP